MILARVLWENERRGGSGGGLLSVCGPSKAQPLEEKLVMNAVLDTCACKRMISSSIKRAMAG